MTCDDLREQLASASNSLYLYLLLCEQHRLRVPESLREAHAAIRSEIRRLDSGTPHPPVPAGVGPAPLQTTLALD